jgi:hypothetical protein
LLTLNVLVFIDVFSTLERHTGEHMADVVAKCLTDWEIENKVMSVICDNASNNDNVGYALLRYATSA